MSTPDESARPPEEPDFSPEAIHEQLADAQASSDLPWTRFEADNPESAYRLKIIMTPEHKDARRIAQRELRYYNRQARKPVSVLIGTYTSIGLWATYASVEGNGEIVQRSPASTVIFGLSTVLCISQCVRDIKAWPKRKARAEQERHLYQQYFGDGDEDSGVTE